MAAVSDDITECFKKKHEKWCRWLDGFEKKWQSYSEQEAAEEDYDILSNWEQATSQRTFEEIGKKVGIRFKKTDEDCYEEESDDGSNDEENDKPPESQGLDESGFVSADLPLRNFPNEVEELQTGVQCIVCGEDSQIPPQFMTQDDREQFLCAECLIRESGHANCDVQECEPCLMIARAIETRMCVVSSFQEGRLGLVDETLNSTSSEGEISFEDGSVLNDTCSESLLDRLTKLDIPDANASNALEQSVSKKVKAHFHESLEKSPVTRSDTSDSEVSGPSFSPKVKTHFHDDSFHSHESPLSHRAVSSTKRKSPSNKFVVRTPRIDDKNSSIRSSRDVSPPKKKIFVLGRKK